MRVALLSARVGQGTGTAGVALRLALALRARGVELVVHADRAEGLPADVRLRPLGDPATAAARVEPGRVRIALDRVPGCELVRASGGVHRAFVGAAATGPWRRARAVADRREERLERRAFADAQRVVANAARVVGEVVAWHGVPAERVRLVRTGVDLDRFRPDPAAGAEVRRQRGAAGRVAVFVGHGFHRKNLATAVAAFQAVASPDDRLWVVGEDARPERWATADRRVELLGARPVHALLPAAHALLLPTRYDPAANATLEALACGVPPCVSAMDGMAEIVPDRRLVVRSPLDVQGFATALRYAWGEADLPARCRAEAERWPVSRMVDALVGLTAEIADG